MVLTLEDVHELTLGVRLGRGKEYYVFMSEHTDEWINIFKQIKSKVNKQLS